MIVDGNSIGTHGWAINHQLPTISQLVHPAGLPPANSPFEAEDDNNFTTDAKNCLPSRSYDGRFSPPTLEASTRQPSLLLRCERRLVGRHGAAPCSAV